MPRTAPQVSSGPEEGPDLQSLLLDVRRPQEQPPASEEDPGELCQLSASCGGPRTSLVTRRPAKRRRIACSYRAASGASATYCAITCSPNQTRTLRRCCLDVISATVTACSPRNSQPLQPVGLTGCHGSNGAQTDRDRSRTWTGPLPDLLRTSGGHLEDCTLSWGMSRDNVFTDVNGRNDGG